MHGTSRKRKSILAHLVVMCTAMLLACSGSTTMPSPDAEQIDAEQIDTDQPDTEQFDTDLPDTNNDVGQDIADTDNATFDADQFDAEATVSVCESSYDQPKDAGAMQDPELIEASGLVASRSTPGVLWLHNDSGDRAQVFALADDGTALGRFVLDQVNAVDFEDIALGPCPEQHSESDCLWIADMGNNSKTRDDLIIYAIPEPEVTRDQPFQEKTVTDVWHFPVAYPNDEGIDSEAMVITPDGQSIFVFEKIDADRARMFRYDAPFEPLQRKTLDHTATFDSVGVPISRGRMITAADLHPSGSRLILRVYTASFEFRFGDNQSIADIETIEPSVVAGGPLSEPQGEAIAYDASGRSVWSVSEDTNGEPGQQLHTYMCLDP